MFRVPLLIALALAIAFGGGILSTLYALDATSGFGTIRLGAWEAYPQAQTAEADPYAKSHRARAGKLLLGGAEGLAFTASVDDSGAKLMSGCSYTLSGQTPPARLWTLYVMDQRGQPMPASPDLPVGINSWTVLRDAGSSFTIRISPAAMPGNWLPLPETDVAFTLALTLLDTPTAGSSGLIDLAMPRLQRIRCGDA